MASDSGGGRPSNPGPDGGSGGSGARRADDAGSRNLASRGVGGRD